MTAFSPLPRIYLSWDQSAESLDAFLRYQVYRRVSDSGAAWSKRARITDRAITFWSDELCASGVTYEYIVTQVIDVAGEEVESDEPSAVSGTVVINDLFVHDVRNPSNYAQVHVPAQQVRVVQPAAFVQPWSRQAPTAHIGNVQYQEYSVSMTGVWESASDPELGSEQWDALVALVTAQRTTGAILMARQGRGVALFGRLEGPQRSDAPITIAEEIRFRETYYREEVD